MEFELKLLPLAFKDLKKAKKWYSNINIELGEDFKIKVNQEFEYICQYPEIYQKKYGELRQALISRFSYSIYYLIEQNLKTIIIVGVLSQKQNYEKAIKRLN